MLKLTVEKLMDNAFYRSQNISFVNGLGEEFDVVDIVEFGVHYDLTVIDSHGREYHQIVGGHETLHIDYGMVSA